MFLYAICSTQFLCFMLSSACANTEAPCKCHGRRLDRKCNFWGILNRKGTLPVACFVIVIINGKTWSEVDEVIAGGFITAESVSYWIGRHIT
jgi:hypothetical protein